MSDREMSKAKNWEWRRSGDRVRKAGDGKYK